MSDDPTTHADDVVLVARAVAGDPGARRTLAARLSPVIRARIARKLGPGARDEDVEDVAQQLWTRLLQADGPLLGRWLPGGLSVENYVGRAAEWEALHHRRAQGRASTAALTEAEDAPSAIDLEAETAARDHARKVFERVSSQLPPKGRLVLAALYVDELTPDEAAELLGVSRQVIYNWQHRIRTLAREGV